MTVCDVSNGGHKAALKTIRSVSEGYMISLIIPWNTI